MHGTPLGKYSRAPRSAQKIFTPPPLQNLRDVQSEYPFRTRMRDIMEPIAIDDELGIEESTLMERFEDQKGLDALEEYHMEAEIVEEEKPPLSYELNQVAAGVAESQCALLKEHWDNLDREMVPKLRKYYEDHIQSCKNQIDVLRKTIGDRFYQPVNPVLKDKMYSLRMECETWMLLSAKLLWEEGDAMNEYKMSDQGTWYGFFKHYQQTRKMDNSSTFQNHMNHLRRYEYVKAWLEKIAAVDGLPSANRNELTMQYTQRKAAADGVHVSLDPDAPLREKNESGYLHEEDEKERGYLYEIVWELLSKGHVHDAQGACRIAQNQFIAGMLDGAQVWPLSEDDQEICEAIAERKLWKECCRELSMRLDQDKVGRSDHEVAIFALLGGDLSRAQKSSTSWVQWYWLHFYYLTDATCDELLYEMLKDMKDVILPTGLNQIDCKPETPSFSAGKSAEKSAENHEDNHSTTGDPFRVLQMMMIRGLDKKEIHRKLANYVSIIASSREKGTAKQLLKPDLTLLPSQVDGSGLDFKAKNLDPEFFLRFAAHLYLSQSVQRGQTMSDDGTNIIIVYIGHLIDTKYYKLVPLYVRYLPERLQKEVYRVFLSSVDVKVAEEVLKDLNCHADYFRPSNLDRPSVIEEIKKGYVHKTLRSIKVPGESLGMSTVEANKRMIEALKFYGASYQALVKDANDLFREFANQGKHESAIELEKFISRRSIGRMGGSDGEEFEDWREYACMLNTYHLCKTVALADRKVKENEATRWRKNDQLDKYIQAFQERLLSPNWLRRHDVIRAKALVHVVNQLLEVCQLFRRYDRALLIADIVADSQLEIYECFSQENQLVNLVKTIQDIHLSNLDNTVSR
mmetsp:Transcript_3029/g.4498  ORF Transcript_3029/g.4498 Transcript_3029/m.4498 type:complete len:856 (-) Transcript_3029:95-2662(-)